MGAANRPGQRYGRYEFARLQRMFDMRRIPRQQVEISYGNGTARPVRGHCIHRRIQHAHRHGHVGRMLRDAGVAGADDRQTAADPLQRAASAARLPLVAGHADVVKIGAAGALKQVSGGRCLVAQLARCPRKQRAAEHCIVAPYHFVRRKCRVANHCPDPQAALGRPLDPVEAEMVDVDQIRGRFDLQLHEVEQIGAPCDEARVRRARGGFHGIFDAGGPAVGEGPHAFSSPATSRIAAMMLG